LKTDGITNSRNFGGENHNFQRCVRKTETWRLDYIGEWTSYSKNFLVAKPYIKSTAWSRYFFSRAASYFCSAPLRPMSTF